MNVIKSRNESQLWVAVSAEVCEGGWVVGCQLWVVSCATLTFNLKTFNL